MTADPHSLFTEADLLPLSAVQHVVFCERQFALIHIERQWRDNALTIHGSFLHARAHESGPRREPHTGLVVARGLSLRSLRLGLYGVADVVEFRQQTQSHTVKLHRGARLPGLGGLWTPYPIEYKRGRPKPDRADEVQLCAQALCLEEMLNLRIEEGALFYGRTQHRVSVQLTDDLRAATEAAASRIHRLARDLETPRVRRAPKCRRCSLLSMCRPAMTGPPRSARRYAAAAIRSVQREAKQP